MKKTILTIAALMAAVSVWADEGMWLLPLLKSLNADVMAAEGCRLTPEQIYSVNHSSLKDAVVIFGGGCTGEIISDEGLLVTNHHCGYSSIQALSTPEHNYLMDGWWAKSRAEEIPCPGLSVTFLRSMEDITDRAVATLEKDGQEGLEKFIGEIEAAASAAHPGCEAVVESFYSGNLYYLIIYQKYDDVRFVGAPPSSIGKFGGDTDNWVWPRHTGDFSMFRVYEDGKPLKARKSLEISLKGVRENDFTLVIGYPGSTQRYQTAAELEQMLATQDISIACRTVRQDILKKHMSADPVIRLQYADKYADSSNGWKKWQGEKLSFERLGLLDKKRADEHAFQQWVDADPARKEKYGTALADIAKASEELRDPMQAFQLVYETLFSIEISQFAMAHLNAIAAGEAGNGKVSDKYKDYNADVDKEVAAAMIRLYRQHAPEAMPLDSLGAGYENFYELDIDGYVDHLFRSSVFTSRESYEKAVSDPEFKMMEDPAMMLAIRTAGLIFQVYPAIMAAQSGTEASRAYTAGLLEYNQGKPLYPDANFTMRLTYGKVLPYEPKDGLKYEYYTTLEGVMEKEIPGDMEFDVPARLKQLYEARDYGRYADKKDGRLHLCFTTDNDITGGNSGSPVLDADGRLIGLAFDGNWESMSSDVIFEPDLTRCICVDIRYVLFCVDKLGGAGYLLKEMKIKK